MVFCGLIFLGNMCLNAQQNLTWFDPVSNSVKSQVINDQDCDFLENGYNEKSKLKIADFQSKPFFVFTNPQIRKYFVNKNMMEADAKVKKVNDNYFIVINFKINSDQAKDNYGNLEKNGKMKIDFINGDHIYLENIERDRGKVRRNKKMTFYKGTFAIDKDDMAHLRKYDLDQITVLWEEGVEEYTIHNVDLIRNQLDCLSK